MTIPRPLRLAALVLLLAPPLGAADLTKAEPARTFPLAPGGRFSLENVNGDVVIEGWSQPQVSVAAVKHGKTQQEIDGIDIAIDAKPDMVKVETRYPSRWFGCGSGSVDYTIKVPAGAVVDEVQLVNGRLTIAGVSGRVKASTVNGAIEASALAGDVSLNTVNGALMARLDSVPAKANLAFESVNGSVHVELPAAVDLDVHVETVNGGIHDTLGLKVEKGQFVGASADGRLGAGGGKLSVETVNGGVELTKR